MTALKKYVIENQNLNSMEENLSYHVLSGNESITEESKLQSLEHGVIVCSKTFTDVSKEVGVFRALKSFYVRYLYILRLWVLREGKILRILCEHYNEVPKWTLSKVFAWLLRTFPVLNRVLENQERALKRRLILSPFSGPMINNKEIDKRLVESFKESRGTN